LCTGTGGFRECRGGPGPAASQQLGYALDSQWYRIPEFTAFMRARSRSSHSRT